MKQQPQLFAHGENGSLVGRPHGVSHLPGSRKTVAGVYARCTVVPLTPVMERPTGANTGGAVTRRKCWRGGAP